jgi:hypothetical protein
MLPKGSVLGEQFFQGLPGCLFLVQQRVAPRLPRALIPINARTSQAQERP